MIKYKKKILLALIFFLFGQNKVFAQQVINIEVNSQVLKNEDFAQLLGGYINPEPGLSADKVTNEMKKMYPQSPEFPKFAVIRTQSNKMYSYDYFAITDEEVEDIIKFCSKVGCDPMFGAFGEGPMEEKNICPGQPSPSPGCFVTKKVIDTSTGAIARRAEFVKVKCRQYFQDDNHCLHWDIGNEPPTTLTPENGCYYYADVLIPTAINTIKQVIPNAVFHAPELFSDTALVRDTQETVGECIARRLNQLDPNLKIDVLTTHWYPYNCNVGGDSVKGVDGNAVLKYDGFGHEIQKMTYPFDIITHLNTWINKYNTTKNSIIGIGELSPMADCKDVDITTYRVNLTWGSAFWNLDVLGIAANAGIKYVQKHIHVGSVGVYEAAVIDPNGNLVKLPPYYAYRFYSQFFGRKIVETTSSDPAVVSSYSSIDKDGNLRTILINKSGSGFKAGGSPQVPAGTIKVRINIPIETFTAASSGESYKMTANFNITPSLPIVKEPDDESFYVKQTNVPVGNNFEYDVPAYSAVILKIPNVCTCPVEMLAKSKGNAICDDVIDNRDLFRWRNEKKGILTTKTADFNCDGNVDIYDLMLWRENHN